MRTVHHIIYVPGLGDSRPYFQDKLIAVWRKHGLIAHYLSLGWADKQPFAPKLESLLARIEELKTDNTLVSLVGVSAGASAVLNAYARSDRVHSVVLISGKVNRPESIGPRYYRINPAFKDSMNLVQGSLKKLGNKKISRIMSIHPRSDGTVPIADTIIAGAVEKQVPVVGHRLSIFYTITIGSKTIASFIKSLE